MLSCSVSEIAQFSKQLKRFATKAEKSGIKRFESLQMRDLFDLSFYDGIDYDFEPSILSVFPQKAYITENKFYEFLLIKINNQWFIKNAEDVKNEVDVDPVEDEDLEW